MSFGFGFEMGLLCFEYFIIITIIIIIIIIIFVGNEMEIDFLCWFYQNKLNRSKKFQSNWFYLVLCLSSRQEKKRKCDLEFLFIFY